MKLFPIYHLFQPDHYRKQSHTHTKYKKKNETNKIQISKHRNAENDDWKWNEFNRYPQCGWGRGMQFENQKQRSIIRSMRPSEWGERQVWRHQGKSQQWIKETCELLTEERDFFSF